VNHRLLFVIGACVGATSPAAAQVGFPPEQSPYRDIRSRHVVSAIGGYLAGSRGQIGIAPSDGRFAGLRYDIALGGPTDASIGAQYAQLKRLVVDPGAAPDVRVSGPVTQGVFMFDVGLSILLTGRKTWHRLSPYLGATAGMAFGEGVPSDSSGFRFRAKFYAGPALGIRWYAAQRLMLRVEGRNLFWQIKYPERFFEAPSRAPDTAPVLLRDTDPSTRDDPDAQWLQHPTLTIGLGYAFRF
jgi:hypothetical protein